MSLYFRLIPETGPATTSGSFPLAGGWVRFSRVEVLSRDKAPEVIAAGDIPQDTLDRLTSPRATISGMSMARPNIMGILNVTPDSFSDGGRHVERDAAVSAGLSMAKAGADILDIGGESTRPGAETVDPEVEISRTAPVIAGLRAAGLLQPVSIDTRKADVAEAALEAGATLVNDVAGFTFDPTLAPLCAARQVPVCVMHAQGDPETMQADPQYDNVLLDVFDFLAERIDALEAAGIARTQIIADPGIGFGKTLSHNLRLLQRISLFHALGVPILLGASRKRFIGTIGKEPQADLRAPGSIAVALAALDQGVQIVRVHDVGETAQAVALWHAVRAGEHKDG